MFNIQSSIFKLQIRGFLLLFFITLGFGQLQVKVSVDKHKIYEGDSITLSVSVDNANGTPSVDVSRIKDFSIVSGPNQSSNIQWINGKMSSNISLSWTIVPKKNGKLIISQLNVTIDGKTYRSQEKTITVYERGKQIQTKTGKKPRLEYFVEGEVDKSNPFRGEQITLTYTLYTRVDLTGFDIKEAPRYKGFWATDLYSPKSLQLREVKKNGEKWYAATVKKMALFPTQSGKIEIEPLTASVGVKVKSDRRSFFSDPFFSDGFFGNSKTVTVASNSVKLDVIPLPSSPRNVSASVGEWNLKTKVNSTDVKQNEAVTLSITLYGKGNLQSVNIEDIGFSSDLEVFEPKVNIIENDKSDRIGGQKMIEYVLIPRNHGRIVIPTINLTYFDLQTNKWKTKSSNPIALNVTPSDSPSSAIIGLTKEEVELMGEDIRFANLESPQWQKRNIPLVSNKTIILFSLSIILLLLPGLVNISQERLSKTENSRKAKKALKKANIHLSKAEETPEQIYSQIHQAVNIYLNYKLHKLSERAPSEIMSILYTRNVTESILDNIKEILERGDAVRYSPISQENAKIDLQNIQLHLKEVDNVWS